MSLASDPANLVESMNLADRPLPSHPSGHANTARNGRPITERWVLNTFTFYFLSEQFRTSEDCEDHYDEQGLSSTEVQNIFGKRKHWDDDHVLKFSVLIPAFNPRLGRTILNQTSDLEVPIPIAGLSTITSKPPTSPTLRLSLSVRGPSMPGVWEATYVIVFREKNEGIQKDEASLPTFRLSSSLPQLPLTTSTNCSMNEVLQLVRQFYINTDSGEKCSQEFLNKKITIKLVTQIQDHLVLSSSSLPTWTEKLTYTYPFLLEIRQLFIHCTDLGSSRSILWLQQQRELEKRGWNGPGLRTPEQHEFSINQESIIEVEIIPEEETGLGPTLEFFALVAGKFQRADLSMWLSDDSELSGGQDMGGGEKPPGYYVLRVGGLFSAHLPQDSAVCFRVSGMFYVLGDFLSKTLQNSRLVDLPLYPAFLKLLCGGKVSGCVRESSSTITAYSPELLEDVITSSLLSVVPEESEEQSTYRDVPWWQGLLELEDLKLVDPVSGVVGLVTKKSQILSDEAIYDNTKAEMINSQELDGSHVVDLELTFKYSPSSAVYGYQVGVGRRW